MNFEEDAKKSREEIFQDIYQHTQYKTELNRNMLATMYANDLVGFDK